MSYRSVTLGKCNTSDAIRCPLQLRCAGLVHGLARRVHRNQLLRCYAVQQPFQGSDEHEMGCVDRGQLPQRYRSNGVLSQSMVTSNEGIVPHLRRLMDLKIVVEWSHPKNASDVYLLGSDVAVISTVFRTCSRHSTLSCYIQYGVLGCDPTLGTR